MRAIWAQRAVLQQLVLRDFRSRYLSTWTGRLWILLHPLLLLALYHFIFTTIFRTRLPNIDDSALLPYVAIGLWPWLAFSEALQRAVGAVEQNAAMLAKVAVRPELFVLAPVISTFGLHLIGVTAVLGFLSFWSPALSLGGLPVLWLSMLLCFAFTLGLSLLLGALNVFIRDIAQILGQALGFLFFLTPVIYAPEALGPHIAEALAWNPLATAIQAARHALLDFGPWPDAGALGYAFGCLAAALVLGQLCFTRLRQRFEDFL